MHLVYFIVEGRDDSLANVRINVSDASMVSAPLLHSFQIGRNIGNMIASHTGQTKRQSLDPRIWMSMTDNKSFVPCVGLVYVLCLYIRERRS